MNGVMNHAINNHENPNMSRTYFVYTYAPVWKRFVAFVLDFLLLLLMTYLFYCLVKMFAFFMGNLNWSEYIERSWYYVAGIIFSLCTFLYFTLLPITSFSSTIGQLIMGLKQIDKTGNRMSFLRANGKFLASFISKIFYIGYLLVYFNPYKQTCHEMITNTFLVER